MLLQIKCNQGLIRVLQINVTKDCRVFEITFLCYRKTVGYYRLHVCVCDCRVIPTTCTRNQIMKIIADGMYTKSRTLGYYLLHV